MGEESRERSWREEEMREESEQRIREERIDRSPGVGERRQRTGRWVERKERVCAKEKRS